MKRAEWKVRIVSWWAMPGAMTFRPPEYPAIKCGSTKPVTNLRSAFTKCWFSPRGTWWVGVLPRWTIDFSSRASWFRMRMFSVTQGSPMSSSSSSPRFGRWRPVAIKIVMPSIGIPPAPSSSITDFRKSLFGRRLHEKICWI